MSDRAGRNALCTVCRAFPTTQEGMRYCEDQFLDVAQQHGLCRPSQTVLSLKDILELHASVVSTMQLTMPLQCSPQPCLIGCSVAVSLNISIRICQMGENLGQSGILQPQCADVQIFQHVTI